MYYYISKAFITILYCILVTAEYIFVICHIQNPIKLVPSNTTRVSFIIVLKSFYKINMFQPN
jgi:hypothetical protein